MPELVTEPLIPRADFDQILAEATARVDALEPQPSRFTTLVRLAEIYHDLSNRLSGAIYASSSNEGVRLACAAGCDTCCNIPSEVRPGDRRSFSMSFLDVIWLVENYALIKGANPEINRKAAVAFDAARTSGAVPPCPHLSDEGGCLIYEQRPISCKIWFSADLALCIQNREVGYATGINGLTDQSKTVLTAFSEPFAGYLKRLDPDQQFWNFDFLTIFSEIAQLDQHDLFGGFAEKVDAGELSSWQPFG